MSNSLRSHGLYVTHQAPLSVGFSRQEYWSGLSFLNLTHPGIKPMSLAFPALAGGFFTIAPPRKHILERFLS